MHAGVIVLCSVKSLHEFLSHYIEILVSSILCMLHADLVILNSRVAPHDLDNLNAFVKPKLLEDSRDEGSK